MLVITKKNKQHIRDLLTAEGLIKEDHFARMIMIPRTEDMKKSGKQIFIDIDCFHCKGTGYQSINHKRKKKVFCKCIRIMDDNITIRYLKIPKAPGMDHKHHKRGN